MPTEESLIKEDFMTLAGKQRKATNDNPEAGSGAQNIP